MQWIFVCQTDITIDTTEIVEIHTFLWLSWRCERVVLGRYPDCKHIVFCPVDKRRGIDLKAEIAAMVFGDFITIDIDLAIGHHSLEVNIDFFPLSVRVESEITPIPAHALIDNVSSAMLWLKTHDMWQSDGLPFRIIDIDGTAVRSVAKEESP